MNVPDHEQTRPTDPGLQFVTIPQRTVPTHLQAALGPSGYPSDLPPVPGYVVRRELARGGMGVVYAAHDPSFDRDVALKVMHFGQDAGRFVIEAKVTAQLPHPGIPPVYAIGELPDGRPFLATTLSSLRAPAGRWPTN